MLRSEVALPPPALPEGECHGLSWPSFLSPHAQYSRGLTESPLAVVKLNSTSGESGSGWESKQNGEGMLATGDETRGGCPSPDLSIRLSPSVLASFVGGLQGLEPIII